MPSFLERFIQIIKVPARNPLVWIVLVVLFVLYAAWLLFIAREPLASALQLLAGILFLLCTLYVFVGATKFLKETNAVWTPLLLWLGIIMAVSVGAFFALCVTYCDWGSDVVYFPSLLAIVIGLPYFGLMFLVKTLSRRSS